MRIEQTNEQQSPQNNADVVVVNGEVFTYKSSGLTRRVFVNADKTKVVKIPTQNNYQHFNETEIKLFNEANEDKRKEIAHTEILENGYIVQEYLHTLDDPTTATWLNRPMSMKEIRFADSCRSDVGYDKDGNLKCFDIHEYKQY